MGGLARGAGMENGRHTHSWPLMTIALLVALAGSLGLMAFIVKRLEKS